MSTQPMSFIVLIVFSLLLPACGKSSKKSKNTAVPDKYFVLGDPLVMLEGTEQTKSSLFTPGNLTDFSDYTLAGFSVFAPKVDTSTIDPITSQKDLEDQNSTDDSQLETELSLYRFEVSGDKAYYRAQGEGFADYPVLEFVQENGQWQIAALGGDAVVPQHYSLSADKRVFSILVSDSDVLGNYLGALTFTRVDGAQKELPDLHNEYQYIAGKGIAIPWAAPVTISICGDLSTDLQTNLKKAITDWSTATGDVDGKLGSLSYQIELVTTPKPFNDVNQHCISMVSNYRLETQIDTAVFGVTLPIVDYQNFSLVDSHIFIFMDALNRFNESYVPTTIHEVGHFWGLGHEFSRSAQGQILHRSVMGYSNVENVTDWDTAAILALYPRP